MRTDKLFLAILMLLTGVAVAEDLRVGVQPANPPFSYTDLHGDLRGFDIDIARALCERIGAECRLVPSDWEDLLPSLREGRLEVVVSSMSITDKRRKLVDFTQKYYESPARFIARRGSGIAISENCSHDCHRFMFLVSRFSKACLYRSPAPLPLSAP